jgi:xanthine dehydrogenase accessory factor
MPGPVLVRGGGEMATGVASVLHRAGFQVALTECAHPRAIRRTVSFAQAIFSREIEIERLRARVADSGQVRAMWSKGEIPVVVDPDAQIRQSIEFGVVVDALLSKNNAGGTKVGWAPLVIGLGPGFQAGRDCHLVVETNRGHNLGRCYDQGQAEPDTGIPGEVGGQAQSRILRSPADGAVRPAVDIGALVQAGETVATVAGRVVKAPFAGVLRGIMAPGTEVAEGEKIGDVDPRGRPEFCAAISEKARLIGLGVLAGILWWDAGRLLPLPPNPNLHDPPGSASGPRLI